MKHVLSDKAKQAIEDVLKRFEQGDLGPVVDILRIQRAENDAPSNAWTLANQVLAYATTGHVDARGFRQWKQVGRSVKKGEKAGFILVPMSRKREVENKETGEVEERVWISGFKSVAVFGYNQTEGQELEGGPVDYTPSELPPLMDVAEHWNLRVKWAPSNGKYWGYFTPGEIVLCTPEESVFFHELAHAAHSRIERLKGGQDAKQEAIAEFSAAVLMQVYGLKDTTRHAWGYIKGYYPNDTLRALYGILGSIQLVIGEIMETAHKLADEQVVASAA